MLLDFIMGAIILILVGLGIYKGLTGLFFGTFAFILSLIIAFFLADIVAQQIFNSPLGDTLREFITSKLSGMGEYLTVPIREMGGEFFFDTSEGLVPFNDAFSGLGPLSSIIAKYAGKLLPSLDIADKSLVDKFVPAIAKLILAIASGIVLFIISLIVLKIFGKITKEWDNNRVFKKINRVLGFVVTAAIALAIINFLLLGAAEVPHVSFFNAIKEMTDGTYMSKYFLNHNWLKMGLNAVGVDTAELFHRYFPPPA